MLLADTQNGGYRFTIASDGTKTRYRTSDAPPTHPEQMDLKITDWCDANCAWCHEGSTVKGQHGNLDAALKVLQGCLPGTEIAIGGGDPLSHPDLPWFLRQLRALDLIPNVTVNGRHLERAKSVLEQMIGEGCLFGVGVSLHKHMPDWDYEHCVVHVIAGVNNPVTLLDHQTPRKVLLLGYKDHGRGTAYRTPATQANIQAWKRWLPVLARKHHLSFDTLAVKQLHAERLLGDKDLYDTRYMGDEGRFSLYLDAVTQTYCTSSYTPQIQRRAWADLTIADMFQDVRNGW